MYVWREVKETSGGKQGSQQGIRHFSFVGQWPSRRAYGACGERYFLLLLLLLSRTVVFITSPVTCKRMMGCGSSFVSHGQILCFIICRWSVDAAKLIRHPSPAARAFQSSLEQHSTPSLPVFPKCYSFSVTRSFDQRLELPHVKCQSNVLLCFTRYPHG
jgi:hypothetical protein